MRMIPDDVTAHCDQHKLCRGCPLGTCVAPLADADSPKWDAWIDERIAAVRALKEVS